MSDSVKLTKVGSRNRLAFVIFSIIVLFILFFSLIMAYFNQPAPPLQLTEKENAHQLPQLEVDQEHPQHEDKPILNNEIQDYKRKIQRALKKQVAKAYPAREKMMRKSGKTILNFEIEDSGNLTNIAIIKSSGNTNLDNAAIKALQLAKLPPPPTDFPRNVSVPVVFSIE